jgi:hypothetical protein
VKTEAATNSVCWRHLPLVLMISVGALLASCKASDDPAKKPSTQATNVSPATAPTAKSPKELALSEFLKTMKLEGKPVLIEFGIVGCAMSETGLDGMIAIHKANTVPGLAFVRVEGNQDVEAITKYDKNAEAVAKYFKDKAPPFPVYPDANSALAKALSATAYPTFLLVDKFGHIRYQGGYPREDLVTWGKTLVAETTDPGGNAPTFGAKELQVKELLASKLPDLKDTVHPLGEYVDKGGLMILFVDTSCPFSAIALKEMPMVAKAIAGQKIGAVVVNNDDAKAKVLAFYAKNDAGAPVVYDTGATTRDQWNVHSVPIAVYIGPTGKIGYQGEAVWANMGLAIEQTLGLPAGTLKFTTAGTGFG